MIELREVNKRFEEKEVLKAVSMMIEDGVITGLFGPSGCGKSTIARVVCGLEKPDSGEVMLDDRPLWNNGSYSRDLGLAVQLVWQQPHAALDPMQRVGAGMVELALYHKLAENRKDASRLTDEVFASVGLAADIKKHFPRQISGGEAQRVAIARALMLDPKTLIMDEATSMLDVSTQANVVSLVKDHINKTGMGVLFISHDKDLLDSLADRMYVFENGTVYRQK